jgi:hypothetical protein
MELEDRYRQMFDENSEWLREQLLTELGDKGSVRAFFGLSALSVLSDPASKGDDKVLGVVEYVRIRSDELRRHSIERWTGELTLASNLTKTSSIGPRLGSLPDGKQPGRN